MAWETSSRAWLANVPSIEMYNGLQPVPQFFCEPVSDLHGAQLSKLLELRAEKKMSTLSAMPKV